MAPKEKPRTTEELIATYQDRSGSDSSRKEAFFGLLIRFRADLLRKCEVRCKQFSSPVNVAEIIAENTFKAYAQKGHFDPTKGKGKTIEDSFLIYLYSIARNELTNYYRLQERKRKGQYYDSSETIITDLPSIDLNSLDTKERIRFEVIQSLSPAHRTVFLTYQAYERLGCTLPRRLLRMLREHLGGVTQNTIRTYKMEARARIEEGVRLSVIAVKWEKKKNG